jgi:hypothetical protein
MKGLDSLCDTNPRLLDYRSGPYSLHLLDRECGDLRSVHACGHLRRRLFKKVQTPRSQETARGNAGDGGLAVNAQLNQPLGIKVDKVGNVYIGDGQ